MFNYKFPDERTEFITYKAGCYAFFIMTFLYLTLQVAQGFQLFGYLPLSDEVLYGFSMIPFFASTGFFVVYAWKHKVYETEREMMADAKREKFLKHQIIFAPFSIASMTAVYHLIAEFSLLKSFITAVVGLIFYEIGMWFFLFRKKKIPDETL